MSFVEVLKQMERGGLPSKERDGDFAGVHHDTLEAGLDKELSLRRASGCILQSSRARGATDHVPFRISNVGVVIQIPHHPSFCSDVRLVGIRAMLVLELCCPSLYQQIAII